MTCPTPHGDKLRALVGNDKLPASDRPGVDAAIVRYEAWTAEIEAIEGTGVKLVEPLVASLNRYKMSIDLDLIFDSQNDFLYRQSRKERAGDGRFAHAPATMLHSARMTSARQYPNAMTSNKYLPGLAT